VSKSPKSSEPAEKKRRRKADERFRDQLVFYITQVERGYQGRNLWFYQEFFEGIAEDNFRVKAGLPMVVVERDGPDLPV
jgi:hypothetical protein